MAGRGSHSVCGMTLLGLGVLVVLLASAGCTAPAPQVTRDRDGWQATLLTDVRTGTQFRVSDISDRPVLIQAFTITCPVCMQQQAEITELRDSGEVPFAMVGLDIDPNGDEASLREYAVSRGYYGLFAHSPPDLTRSLVSQFGMGILSPAKAPLVLVCPDGTSRLLDPGVKSADDLRKVLTEGCRA